jgi:hypothetical protein
MICSMFLLVAMVNGAAFACPVQVIFARWLMCLAVCPSFWCQKWTRRKKSGIRTNKDPLN